MNNKKTMFLVASLLVMGAQAKAFASNIHDYNRTNNEGKFNLYLRAVHIDTRIENGLIEDNFGSFPFGDRLGGTALGLVADYNSGYWRDSIGFDASLYGVAKLDARPENRDLFDDTSGDSEGFAKLGQANLKLRHVGDNWFALLQAGRGRFDAGTVVTLDTRAVPGSLQGARGQIQVNGLDIGPLPGVLNVDAAYFNRVSPRDREDFERIVSNSGFEVDDIQTFSIGYDAKLFALKFAQGVAKDFNRNTSYAMTLRAPLGERGGVIFETQYYDFRSDGSIWERDWLDGTAGYDDKASWLNLNLGMQVDRWSVGLSYSKTRAELSNGRLGYAFFDHGENVDGLMDAWTRSGNDFNNDDERTWQIAAKYEFDGKSIAGLSLDGFNVMALFKRGRFDATNPFSGMTTDVRESQTEYRLNYRFEEPDYQGLSVGVIYTRYWIDQDFVALVSAQPNNVVNGKELRMYVDYAF
ncbi:OprD family outer membrane porin [Phytopseudomonas daroniae]|uniref:OprD family outer membrane porin n=1 Tax=Phytopseudomonas daroniae TaxID=2487519 RepID=UPI001038599C|nr:OprD family outer membrane porin [Pseudomonas daroniae]TBU72863.1 outer membrane porin, OprD family [Pseudomonas daroniae]